MSTSTLEDRVEELESKLEALGKRCDELEWRMAKMAVAKLSDPRYPYWNWLLGREVPEVIRVRSMLLLSALNDRVTGLEIPDEYKKDIEGVSRDVLYGSGPPPVEEVLAAIKSITGMKHDSQVLDMLRAVDEQGMFSELCEHVLSASDE